MLNSAMMEPVAESCRDRELLLPEKRTVWIFY
jgi:hypothetical protein